VIARARVRSLSYAFGRPNVSVELPDASPVASFFDGVASLLKGPASSEVTAAVCVDCGYIELRAERLAELRRAFDAIPRTSLNLPTATEP
jgi:hypothetical protein